MATEYVSRAWEIYKKNFPSFIGSELIAMIIPGILILLGVAIFLGSILPGLDWNLLTNTTDENVLAQYFIDLFNIPEFQKDFVIGLIGFGSFFLVSILISLYLIIGQYGMAYESLRKKTRIATMFKVSRKIGLRWIATSFLLFIFGVIVLIPVLIISVFTLGLGFIAVLLFIPIITLIAPAMVVDNTSPIESIKKAFRMAKRNYLNLFALWLVYLVISLAISFMGGLLDFIPIVGGLINLFSIMLATFVITPMIKISFVDFYSRNRKGKGV